MAVLCQALFFDPLLSGNRDTSCATCHHPEFGTSDGLSLSIGTGGRGLGPSRTTPRTRNRIPRNATDLFNRGLAEWRTMFWDGRVLSVDDRFLSTALDQLPDDLDSPLAVQSMFPVTSRDEMRGFVGDIDIDGETNELALIDDTDFSIMWTLLMRRLLAIPEYRDLFSAAYPHVPLQDLGFEHAANALASFQVDQWTLLGSPWDRYVAGADDALSEDAKHGALLFYGAAGCSECHSGPLLTDQEHHNIAVPQLGPGKGVNAPLDLGRFYISAEDRDRFAFRTPPLRNVAITGPWMHNGAYTDLENAVRHHLDVHAALDHYDVEQLEPELRTTYWGSPAVHSFILETLDPLVMERRELSDVDVGRVMSFLESLTDARAIERAAIPSSVPSGLTVERGTQ
jgi:cytochrome c peroxidase